MRPLQRHSWLAVLVAIAAAGVATPRAVRAEGVEVIPILGAGEGTGYHGKDASFGMGLGWGPLVGISLGGRASRIVSLHGQFQANYLGVTNVPSGVDAGGFLSMMSFAALFHVLPDLPEADVVVGPTLGMYGDYLRVAAGEDVGNSWHMGLHLGISAAAFYRINPRIGLGPYLQWTRLFALRECIDAGGDNNCDPSPKNSNRGFFILGLAMSL